MFAAVTFSAALKLGSLNSPNVQFPGMTYPRAAGPAAFSLAETRHSWRSEGPRQGSQGS